MVRVPDETTVTVPRSDLYKLYSLLADATGAAATGDPNECAAKAAEAKEFAAALYEGDGDE